MCWPFPRVPRLLLLIANGTQAAAKNPSGQRFHYITADVSVPDYADGLVQEAIKWNGGKALDVVWAIAGFSVPQLLLDMDIQSMRNQMNVNYYGAVELALAICRVWLAPNAPVEDEPKHLILTISAAIFSPVAGYGPYAPSKAALRIFAEHLSSEVDLYPQNVKVHVCVPGSIQSEGMTRENTTKPDLTLWLEETDPMQSPEDSARAFIQGLEKGHYFLTSNWLTQIMIWGGLQNSRRNYNFIFDLFGVILTYFVWLYFRIELASKGKQYAKKHGHPATWIKKSSS